VARRKKKNNGKRSKTAGDRIYDITKNVIPYVAFANQITSKDYKNDEGTGVAQQASYRNENMTTKAKIFTNIVIGRMSGYTPFKNGNLYDTENTPFTVNPSGMVNKWTTLGVAGLIYKNLGIKQLPQKQKVGAIAKRVLLSGLIGGVFDAPSAGNSTVTTMSTVRRNPSVISHNRQATLQTGMYSPSGDPTGSGFSN
tara:strand:+ start:343 stop:933 length:591 start_codon:yes stop_codon:yes gene_type:complete